MIWLSSSQPLQGLDVGGKLFRQTALVHALESQNRGILTVEVLLGGLQFVVQEAGVRVAWLPITVNVLDSAHAAV